MMRRNMMSVFVVLMLLLVLAVPVLAQDGDAVVLEAQAEVLAIPADGIDLGFWLVLLGALLGTVIVSVLVNRYLNALENKLPPWASGAVGAMAPYAYQQGSHYFNAGVDMLQARAATTPATWDDDLVEIVDKYGNRSLAKIVQTFGYKLQTGKGAGKVAEPIRHEVKPEPNDTF